MNDLCLCACKKLGLFFYTWLCSLPNTDAMHAELKAKGCPKTADYVQTACKNEGTMCVGWQAIWDSEKPIILDWEFTDGQYRSCKGINE